MKRFFTIAFLLLLMQGVFAQIFKNKDLSVTKLENDMWVIETTDNTTMYIVEGKDKAMLIDTGTKCDSLDEVVKKITKKPLYVVVTHIHPDHSGNINNFSDIYFHPADTVLMKHLGKSYSGKVHFIKDGYVFDLGSKQIEVSHMPGHTPGSIVLLDKQTGSCFSGDAFGSGQVWLQLWPFSPMKTYIKTCEKMEKLMDKGITKIYCGHYPYVKKAYGKAYIDDMLKLAITIDKGKVYDAKPYPTKIVALKSKNPMIATLGLASIVYEPIHIK